jgi:type 1 fimbria pilin
MPTDMKLPFVRTEAASRSVNQVRIVMRVLALLTMLAALAAFPRAAKAADSNCVSSSVAAFSLGAVTVEPNTPNGTLLGTPSTVSVTFTCTNIPVLDETKGHGLYVQASDLYTLDPSDTGSNGIIFDTSIPGIGLKVTGTPFQTKSEACLRCGFGSTRGFEIGPIPRNNNGSGSISNTFVAQFIKTGNVTPGTVGAITRLIRFYWYEYGKTASSGPMSGVLRLASGATVTAPTCTINDGSEAITVILPTISSASLNGGLGTTAGRTRFNIELRCQVGARLRISMDSTRAGLYPGVVRPTTTGTGPWASNVGVQILDGAFNAVPFDQDVTVGNTPATGAWSLPYYAQYYRYTNGGISAGKVAATVTYLLDYD